MSYLFREHNLTVAGGELDAGGKRLFINPSGEFHSEEEIAGVTVGTTPYGTPLYMRDVADTIRDYDSPPRFLNFYSWQDAQGNWQRTRTITLTAQMGAGMQVHQFATAVSATLTDLQERLPKDLVIARTSDQPKQVEENVDLFMTRLYEAIILVVVVSLVGFWEWRSALLMALSIPLTLLMTFGNDVPAWNRSAAAFDCQPDHCSGSAGRRSGAIAGSWNLWLGRSRERWLVRRVRIPSPRFLQTVSGLPINPTYRDEERSIS